ncbi:MAG: hypothetical protein IPP91_07645 [Betaproteobacteria bacterium]|nr:hypothetical protein [Betaproteobacteria bacterium]
MKALFDRYLNQSIGLNYHTAYHIDGATLTLAADTYFAALGEKDGITHYYPYSAVIHVMEKAGGVVVGGLFTHKQTWPLVVKVGHVVDVGPMV